MDRLTKGFDADCTLAEIERAFREAYPWKFCRECGLYIVADNGQCDRCD